jgi:hypothetical protein
MICSCVNGPLAGWVVMARHDDGDLPRLRRLDDRPLLREDAGPARTGETVKCKRKTSFVDRIEARALYRKYREHQNGATSPIASIR